MITLPALPYEYDALEPAMSADTLHFHHDKHHRAYVEKTNELAKAAGVDGKPLEEIVALAREKTDTKLFNQAAQAWNHAFFWHSMTPGAAKPDGAVLQAITDGFGGLSGFREKFVKEGEGHFGSGWIWLAAQGETLSIVTTHDADTLADTKTSLPLLVCDLWEHAYYLDKHNDRKAYLEGWLDHLADWTFAAEQFQAARAGRMGYRFAAEEMA